MRLIRADERAGRRIVPKKVINYRRKWLLLLRFIVYCVIMGWMTMAIVSFENLNDWIDMDDMSFEEITVVVE